MTADDNGPADGTGGQSVNTPSDQASNDISSLARFRAQQVASTAAKQEPQQGGAVAPTSDVTTRPEREPFIPRERFDEVNTKLKSEVDTLKESVTQLTQMLQQQRYQPMSGPVQPQPTQQHATGMTVPQQPSLPDFNDPAVKKQWSDRMYKDPIPTLFDLVEKLIEAKGTPLLQQFQQQIAAQLTPLQQTFVHNQLAGYEQQRSGVDPSFQAIRGTFQGLVNQAVQQNIPLTPQTLQAIEGIARVQHGLPFGAPTTAPATPFSEQPGTASNVTQPQTPTLTREQRRGAQLFGMTEAEYAERARRLGVME